MKKYSVKIKADKMLNLMKLGFSSMEIAILLDEIKKEAQRNETTVK